MKNLKKLLGIIVIGTVITASVFAQDKAAASKGNWVSAEVSLIGIGARYERMLSPNLSVGANVYWSSLFFLWNELEAGAFARYYPWGKNFFVGAGLGFHIHTAITDEGNWGLVYENITGAAITPELGWKIDVGNTGGFFIQPGIRLPITLGVKEKEGFFGDENDGEFSVGVGFIAYFGLGFAF
jgi:hypothetical protein